MVVTLTQIEMEIASLVGVRRRTESRARGIKNAHGYGGNGGWDTDIEGASAEMAFCKFRKCYWGGSLNEFKNADTGKNIQIRSTPRDNGCLIIRPGDLDEHYYVLMTGTSPTFRVCGWIKGKDGKVDQFIESPNDRPPAYFVPQSQLRQFKTNL